MKQITLAQEKNGKYLFTLREDGVKKCCYEFKATVLKSQQQIARDVGVKVEQVLKWIEETGAVPRDFVVDEPKATAPSLYVRAINVPRSQGEKCDLSAWSSKVTGTTETLLDWDSRDDLCCLDVDYHDVTAPTAEWLETTVTARLVPRPFLWHLSRNGGLHCFYQRTAAMSASEIASLAAIRWRAIDPSAKVELKTQVRCAGEKPCRTPPGYETANSFVTEWLGILPLGSSDEKIQSYLEAEGLTVSGRYEHDRCPIDPSDTAERQPVVVGEDGLYCHRCAGKGLTKGSTKPGFVPWSVLVGMETAGVLRTMVHNRTHWGHAKWVIEASLGLTGEIAKLGYSAALKLYHGPNATEGVFHPDTDVLVRLAGHWGTVIEGYTFPKDGIKPLLQALPVVIDPATDKPSASRVTRLEQPSLDHTELGYPAVEVVKGFKIAGHRNAYRDLNRYVVAVAPNWLRPFGSAFYPRYRKGDVGKAEALIEQVLPNIDWNYTRALIVARGCNEARVGSPQHLLVTGCSGAAKTSHVNLAAGIMGDVATEVPYETDMSRFRAAIRDASEAGGLVVVNEFLKDSLRMNGRLTAEQVLDPLLNMTPNSLSHKLYLGPTALGNLGVMIWTETWIPEALRDHLQIARRVHYLKLTKRLDWHTGMAAHQLSRIELIRTISPDHAHACDVIMTDVIDRFFQVLLPFDVLAPTLGVQTMEKSDEFVNSDDKLRRFFDLVCEAPDPDPATARKFPGAGFKVITKADDGELPDLWSDFADGYGMKQWQMSRRLVEKDWSAILKVGHTVHLDVKSDTARVAVRFRVGRIQSPTKVNHECLDCL